MTIADRDARQAAISRWAASAFGVEEATSIPQRGMRLLEEAVEAFQACGCAEAKAHEMVRYVFGRPVGEIGQELGGVAVTTLALAAAAGLSAEQEECREVHRVLSKPLSEFAARNAAKNAAGFLVVTPADECPTPPPKTHAHTLQSISDAALRALSALKEAPVATAAQWAVFARYAGLATRPAARRHPTPQDFRRCTVVGPASISTIHRVLAVLEVDVLARADVLAHVNVVAFVEGRLIDSGYDGYPRASGMRYRGNGAQERLVEWELEFSPVQEIAG